MAHGWGAIAGRRRPGATRAEVSPTGRTASTDASWWSPPASVWWRWTPPRADPSRNSDKNGVVDLYDGMRWPDGVQEIGALGNSSPAVVVGDAVVLGPALKIGMLPRSKRNVPGDVRAFDVRSGGRALDLPTPCLPRGEFGYETWLDGSAEYSGNAGAWAPMAVDRERGLVYVPVEAGTSDMYGGHRPGDNLFSSTLVALDAATGERVWHYQLVHHDIWDFDIAANPILADVVVDGRPREVVVQLTKQAFAYVLDRETGEPIWPIEERPVPTSDVPGEWTAPTQPFPTRPAPFDVQGISEAELNDLTPEVHALVREYVAPYRLASLYEPISLAQADDGTEGTIALPAADGGARWESGAYDPETGVLYVPSVTTPYLYRLAPEPRGQRPGLRHHVRRRQSRGASSDPAAMGADHGNRPEQR